MLDFLPYFWLAVIVFMAICEVATSQLVSIWFVVGGIAALITSLITDDWLTQVLIFVAVTVVTLIATRPVVRKFKAFKITSTNSDRYIGKTGLVTDDINNELGKGQVNVEGSVWTARSSDGSVIAKGKNVLIESIEGVKLIVSEK